MQFDWRLGNLCLVLLSLAGGYARVSPDRLPRSNADGVMCLAVLFGAMVIGAVGPFYALKIHGAQMIRRPSWWRGPFGLWRDPFQFLATATVASFAAGIGSLLSVSAAGWISFWTITAPAFAAFAGLLVGQTVAYRMLRDRVFED